MYTYLLLYTDFFRFNANKMSAINGLGGENKKEAWRKIQEEPKLMKNIGKWEGKTEESL